MSAREKSKSSRSERLKKYRAKRSAEGTSEPFGGREAGSQSVGKRLFVVQKHRASSLHWDLRLEMHGVLVSWAVPKGPSPNQADKRLAVHVEDHPLEYADFEGVIPADNYGAGPSIIWDRGNWTAVEDPDEGMRKGKLLFDLHGHKLRGRWTLVQTKQGGGKHWLFIKERDLHEKPEGGTDDYPDDSIFSGLTVEQLGEGGDFGAEIRERCAELGATQAKLKIDDVKLMHPEGRAKPFSREGWVFEIKYDGYRLLAGTTGGKTRLLSRNGNDLTQTFPDVNRAVRGLPYGQLIIDGEVVVNDAAGLPSFSHIQQRGQLRQQADIERAAVDFPATYYAFDLLAFEGYDLRDLPLTARKELLAMVLPSVGPIRFSEHFPTDGKTIFKQVTGLGLEGVVGKRADSSYAGRRSGAWIKVRETHTGDFVICGFTEPSGSRVGFGALHLARYEGKTLIYAGRVGTGFSQRVLDELRRRLDELDPDEGPEGMEAAGKGEHHWLRPELVAEVEYREVTRLGLLRHSSFIRLREDKAPEECLGSGARTLPEPVSVSAPNVPARTVRFSNLDKIFWPEDGFSKGDMIDYYRSVAPWILPHLADRPVVLTRYPDGIDRKSFYQKNAPGFAPDWIRRISIYSEGSEREIDYFLVDDVESLLYMANSASIPLHIWLSRVGEIGRPDYCVLDLDPKDAPFADVVKIALFLKEVCDEIALPTFVKTSGSTGLHIMIPLGQQLTYGQSRDLGQLLALMAVRELETIATVARQPSQRDGKVYVDYVQNGQGRLIAAPYCVRPRPGAPVATPLDWEEVNNDLVIDNHTIRSLPKRMKAMGRDPLEGLLELKLDLVASVGRLQGLG